MPYATGTTSTASGLFDAISTFLVSDCGWNLHDTVTSSGTNKVFYSEGSSGTEKIYARFEYGLKDYDSTPTTHYWQNQEFPNAHYQHVNASVMQHWDAGTNTATAEQIGRIGPWMFHQPSGNTTGVVTNLRAALHKNSGSSIPVFELIGLRGIAYGSLSSYYFDGNSRFLYSLYSNLFARCDLIYSSLVSRSAWTAPTTGRKFILAPNPSGIICLYTIRCDSAAANPWQRTNSMDLSAGNITLTNPPAGAVAYDNSSMVWDGKDSIYLTQGEGSTGFYKYTISTDSWATMTAQPAASGTNNTGDCLVYIPQNSSVGIANSWTSDRIYFKRATAVNSYYYTVNTDTWSASIGTGSTYTMSSAGSSIVWNGQDYIYGTAGNNANLRALNLSTNEWTAIDTLPAYAATYGSDHLIIPDSLQNQIVIDSDGSTYWLFGDLDKLIVVTKDSDNIYRVFYVGIIDSYYSTQKVVTTATASAGTNVSISVSGVFDQFQSNQPLYIVDPSLGGKAQRFTYSSSGVNTIIAGSLNQTYTAGSIIGVDPQPVVMLCNNFDAVFPVHGPDGPGAYGATNNNLGQYVLQNLIPTTAMLTENSLPGRRGHYQLWPITVGMWESLSNANDEYIPYDYVNPPEHLTGRANPINLLHKMAAWNSQTAPLESRGQLNGMYCIKTGTAPAPVSEDEIQIGNDTYMVFKCANLFDEAWWNLSLAIGPK